MKVLAIIPARAGSKRLPGKNMKLLAGKPLVQWVVEAAFEASLVDTVVVSSDDAGVLDLAERYRDRGMIALRRPTAICGDQSPASEYVQHALDQLRRAGQSDFGAVAIVQPSSPLTLPEDIDGTIRLLADSTADSAVSVVRLDHAIHPLKMKVMEGNRLLPFLEEERGRMLDHELPPIYVRNGSVYAARVDTIRSGQIIGEDCRGYVMPPERSVDINTLKDLVFAEFLLSRLRAGIADAR